MAKWFGEIGFEETIEVKPGVWTPQITKRNYYGDVVRVTRRNQTADKVNPDITVSSEISIVADPFANENFYAMRYVEFMGAKWEIESVEPMYPRLQLSLGGVYNGE